MNEPEVTQTGTISVDFDANWMYWAGVFLSEKLRDFFCIQGFVTILLRAAIRRSK